MRAGSLVSFAGPRLRFSSLQSSAEMHCFGFLFVGAQRACLASIGRRRYGAKLRWVSAKINVLSKPSVNCCSSWRWAARHLRFRDRNLCAFVFLRGLYAFICAKFVWRDVGRPIDAVDTSAISLSGNYVDRYVRVIAQRGEGFSPPRPVVPVVVGAEVLCVSAICL